MQELKLRGIVTRAVPYGENDLIVTIVGVEEGVVGAKARGCLKAGAKLRYSASLFNFGDYILGMSKGGHYVILDCSQMESFSPILNELERYYSGCLILDMMTKLLKEPHPVLYGEALKTLHSLAYSDVDADRLVTDFMLTALRLSGSALDFANCAVCGCKIEEEAYYSVSDGIVCPHCKRLDSAQIDPVTRAYIAGECDPPRAVKIKAGLHLLNIINQVLGVNISASYLTEQI